MKYNAPPGSTDPNAGYVNGIPGVKKGSPIAAEVLEHTQREIVEVIKAAGLTPNGEDLTQLLQALQKMQLQPGPDNTYLASFGGKTEWRLGRVPATADVTVYVRETGNDVFSGLEEAQAVRTIARAFDVINMLDMRGYNVLLDVGAGPWGDVVFPTALVGVNSLLVRGAGDSTHFLCAGTGMAFPACNYIVGLSNFKMAGAGYYGLRISGCTVQIGAGLNFGGLAGAGGAHVFVESGGAVVVPVGYTISGGAFAHCQLSAGASLFVPSSGGKKTVAVSGSPAFSGAFLDVANTSSVVTGGLLAFSGAATGKRFSVRNSSLVNTGGGGANVFPGNIAGTADTATGGYYV